MAKFFYQMPIESTAGRRLTDFWHSCISVERLADKYAKRMGGQYYYSDPNYFAGGVAFISFPGNKPQDPTIWREVGVQHEDGSFTSVREPAYHGATAAGDIVYFEPNVTKVSETIEVGSADFKPTDTFDCIHDKRVIERDGKFFVRRIRFEYDEEPGHSGGSANGQRVASRSVRRAIKAEMQRMKLPVMRVESLLGVLGATGCDDGDGGDKPMKTALVTPTFFAYETNYFVGCEYECKAKGLEPITPQTYQYYSDKYLRQQKKKKN